MKAHGVPWLLRHLARRDPLEEAAEGGKHDTRRYTKRQVTWFRHQMPDWTWVEPADALAAAQGAGSPVKPWRTWISLDRGRARR